VESPPEPSPHDPAPPALGDDEWLARGGIDIDEGSEPADPDAELDELDEDLEAAARRRRTRSIVEWGLVIVGALAAALLVKAFVIQAFFIPSGSMEPTLNVGDRVFVNKLSYKLHDVHRGDLVVFERPPNEAASDIKDLIKRVVALDGETVEGHDGKVYVDGEALDEDYLPSGTYTTDFDPQKIPKDHVFVMGDNRGNSQDSRVFGPIDEELIVGRAFIRVWPPSDLSFL
jgi:signal peptidase I